jgi:hypothetical protein
MKIWQKTISVIATFALLFNSLAAPLAVLAQESTPEPIPTPTDIASPEPTAEAGQPTISPTDTATPVATPDATPAETASPTPEITPAATDLATPTPSETPNVTQAPESNPTVQGPPDSNNPILTPTATPQTPIEHGNLTTTVIENIDLSGVIGLNTHVDVPTVTTDKPDYSPTSVALITGTGFTAEKSYTLTVGSTDQPPVIFNDSVATNSQGSFTYTYQLDGSYRPNYKVEVKDEGKQVIASVTFTDSVPVVTIDSGPSNPSSSTSATFSFHATAGSTFQCSLDDSTLSSCGGTGTGTINYSGLNSSSHKFQVMATDAGGTGGLTAYPWVINTSLVPASVTSFPSVNDSNSTAVTLSGACETGYTMSLTVGSVTASPAPTCVASAWTKTLDLSSLSDGTLTAIVTQTDSGGNTISTGTKTSTKNAIAPTLSPVHIQSNNSDTSKAKVGDTITVSFTPSKSVTGTSVTIAGHAASLSGSGTGPYSATYVMASGDGEGTVVFNISGYSDTTGNTGSAVSSTSDSSSVTFDKTAPSVSAAVSAGTLGLNSWYTSNVTVSFTCSDTGGSGIASCPADQVLSTEGGSVSSTAQTATDNAGNTSAPSNLVAVKIDKTSPIDPSVISTSHTISTWSNDNTIDMSWSGATDALSGVAGYSYLFDTNTTTIPDTVSEGTGTSTTSSPLGSGNSYYFHLRTEDSAGNWTSTVHVGPFFIDTSDPTVSATGSSTGWQTSVPAITVSASDTVSGVASVKYAWDGSAASGAATSNGANLASTYPGNGDHTLNLQVTDNAGRTGSFSGEYKIDTGYPTTPGAPSTTTPTNSTTQTWTWTASTDAVSGVANYLYRISGDTVVASTSTGSSSASFITNLVQGIYTFFVKAVDNAGNTGLESSGGSLTVDTTKPTISAAVSAGTLGLNSWYTSNVTVGFTCSDSGGPTSQAVRVIRF